jgi:hypothetical protein
MFASSVKCPCHPKKRNLEFILMPVLVYVMLLDNLSYIKTNFRYKLASSLLPLLLLTDGLKSLIGVLYRPPTGRPRNLALIRGRDKNSSLVRHVQAGSSAQHASYKQVQKALSSETKRLARKADHSVIRCHD